MHFVDNHKTNHKSCQSRCYALHYFQKQNMKAEILLVMETDLFYLFMYFSKIMRIKIPEKKDYHTTISQSCQ